MILPFLETFIDWAHAGLSESDDAQNYLLGRGSSSEQWARHRIGYVHGEFLVDVKEDPAHGEDCFDKEKRHKRCDSCKFRAWSTLHEEDAEGNVKHYPGRRIIGHIVLPLTTYSGSVVGFQIRSVTEKSYDTFILNRRPEAYAFGLGTAAHHIWASGSAWPVEGPFDYLVMERLVTPASFALTTSSLNVLQTRFLMRFAKRVYWCGDLDQAGRDGLESLRKWHMNDFDAIVDVKYPKLQPKDKDPGDFWRRAGDKKFAEHFRRMMT